MQFCLGLMKCPAFGGEGGGGGGGEGNSCA